jgi:hypothetical protein
LATSKTHQNHEILEMLAPLTRLGTPHISAPPRSLDHGAFTVAPPASEPALFVLHPAAQDTRKRLPGQGFLASACPATELQGRTWFVIAAA